MMEAMDIELNQSKLFVTYIQVRGYEREKNIHH